MQKKFLYSNFICGYTTSVLYIFSTTNLNKISPDNKQGLYLVEHAFPQYKVIKTFYTGIHLQASTR